MKQTLSNEFCKDGPGYVNGVDCSQMLLANHCPVEDLKMLHLHLGNIQDKVCRRSLPLSSAPTLQ